MHATLFEERRSSNLSRIPVVLTGPGGDFTQQLLAQGQQLVCEPEPTSEPPALVRPQVAKPTPPHKAHGSHLRGVAIAVAVIVLIVLGNMVWRDGHFENWSRLDYLASVCVPCFLLAIFITLITDGVAPK